MARGIRSVEVVPLGATLPSPLPSEPKASSPTLIFVGRMAKNKRPDHALEAFRLIKGNIEECVLWMVGTGPIESELMKTSPPDTHFFGKVTQEEKFSLIAKAHALLATSVREGWGLTVTEAGALGTLPIGYRIPGLVDSIAQSEGVIADENPKALAVATIDAIRSGKTLSYRRHPPPSWDSTADACLEAMRVAAGAMKN